MAEISLAPRRVPSNNIEGEKYPLEQVEHAPIDDNAGLSETQKTLANAAATQKAKGLGTFSSIKYYWVAFLWSQYCSLGALLVGYDGTVTGSVLSVPAFREALGKDFGGGQYVIDAAWQVGFNTGGTAASIIGSLFYPLIGDRVGRKGCLIIASVISIISVFLEFFVIPGSQIMWFWGKALNGIATGFFATTSSSYAIEVSPLQLRGATTGAVSLYISCGQLISALVIQSCGNRPNASAYKIPIAMQWVFTVVILAILPFCPESPWVLVKQGKIDKAKRSLKRLYGNTEDDLDMHLKVIEETLEFEARLHAKTRWFDMFKGSDGRRTWIIMLQYWCQQATGVQFVLFFGTYFFQLVGLSNQTSFSLNVGTLALAVLGNLIGIGIMNRAGRRPVFLTSVYLCTIDTLLIGVCSLVPGQGAVWASAIMTMLYMFFFEIGLGPLTYCYTAEIGSARMRSKVIAWGNMCNQFYGLLINIVNPYMINPDQANMEGKVGWVFGGLGLVSSVVCYFTVPETGNRTVDELDLMFKKKIPARKFKQYQITNADRMEMEQDAEVI